MDYYYLDYTTFVIDDIRHDVGDAILNGVISHWKPKPWLFCPLMTPHVSLVSVVEAFKERVFPVSLLDC